MEGFLHVWRANAFYMGVDEESNLVKDDMDKTKSLLRDIGHFILVPALLNLNEVSQYYWIILDWRRPGEIEGNFSCCENRYDQFNASQSIHEPFNLIPILQNLLQFFLRQYIGFNREPDLL